jgi:hypothetical protein
MVNEINKRKFKQNQGKIKANQGGNIFWAVRFKRIRKYE